MALVTRRPKWQYPPPAPRVLQLPRMHGGGGGRGNSGKVKTQSSAKKDRRGKLEALFDQERSFDRRGCTCPEPIVVVSGGDWSEYECDGGAVAAATAEEEKWRVQAEMLRAECTLLRMEKEIALKKMDRRRERLERTLRSAVLSLLSGRQKIAEGKDVSKVLEQEINHLAEKLYELSRNKKVKDNMETGDCKNFDRQTSVLRRQLEKFDDFSDPMFVEEIGEMAEASPSIQPSSSVDCDVLPKSYADMDILRSKVKNSGILLERTETNRSSILLTPISSVSSSTAGSNHIDLPDMIIQHTSKETSAQEQKKECSRHCKEVVRRIMEEVRAENEQWSQMQEMLGQVRDEMEKLQASRDFWQDRALESDFQMQDLRSSVQEWQRRAESSEAKEKSLESEVWTLQGELERLRKKDHKCSKAKVNLPSEKEKRVLICRLKENCHTDNDERTKCTEFRKQGRTEPQTVHLRVPLREIRSSSTPMRQNGCNALPSRFS